MTDYVESTVMRKNKYKRYGIYSQLYSEGEK